MVPGFRSLLGPARWRSALGPCVGSQICFVQCVARALRSNLNAAPNRPRRGLFPWCSMPLAARPWRPMPISRVRFCSGTARVINKNSSLLLPVGVLSATLRHEGAITFAMGKWPSAPCASRPPSRPSLRLRPRHWRETHASLAGTRLEYCLQAGHRCTSPGVTWCGWHLWGPSARVTWQLPTVAKHRTVCLLHLDKRAHLLRLKCATPAGRPVGLGTITPAAMWPTSCTATCCACPCTSGPPSCRCTVPLVS